MLNNGLSHGGAASMQEVMHSQVVAVLCDPKNVDFDIRLMGLCIFLHLESMCFVTWPPDSSENLKNVLSAKQKGHLEHAVYKHGF